MGIRFLCQFCQKKIHVKAYLAGKKAECPHCNGRIRIPDPASEGQETRVGSLESDNRDSNPLASSRQSSSSSKHVAFASQPNDPNSFTLDRPEEIDRPTEQRDFTDWISDDPNASWYLRNPDGKQFGPAAGPMMRSWVGQGRVTEGCFVWREGWANWRRATDVFGEYFQSLADKDRPIFIDDEAENAAPEPQVQENFTNADKSKTKKKPNKDTGTQVSTRAGNSRWLFLGILLMVFVLIVIGIASFYQINANNGSGGPGNDNINQEKSKPEKIVDPFADSEQKDS